MTTRTDVYTLRKEYTKKTYDTVGKMADSPQKRALSCAHLIVGGRPETLNQIRQLGEGVDEKLPGGSTCLHIAAMCGHAAAVRALLEANADPKSLDSRKWTPLDLAMATQNEETISLLGGAAVVDRLRPRAGKSDIVCNYLPPNASKVVPISRAKFTELTKAEFTPRDLFTPEYIVNRWRESKPPINLMMPPPPDADIYLGGKGRRPQGLGVFAGEAGIAAGTVVTPYAGRRITNSTPSGDAAYLYSGEYGTVDAKEERNLGSMINDGPPNCVILPYRTRPHALMDVVVATRPIRPREELFVNFGHQHECKDGIYHLADSSDFQEWLRRVDLQTLIVEFGRDQRGLEERPLEGLVEFHMKYQYLFYLIDTPRALIEGVLKGTITLHQFHVLIDTMPIPDAAHKQRLQAIQTIFRERGSQLPGVVELFNEYPIPVVEGAMMLINPGKKEVQYLNDINGAASDYISGRIDMSAFQRILLKNPVFRGKDPLAGSPLLEQAIKHVLRFVVCTARRADPNRLETIRGMLSIRIFA